MAQPQRLRYFDQQFLRVDDFVDEQTYHRDMRRRHNRMLHTPGICEGLKLTADGTAVRVSPGAAVAPGAHEDGGGAEIVLDEEVSLDLSSLPADAPVYVAIRYAEEESRELNDAGVTGSTRWLEKPVIELLLGDPTGGPTRDDQQRVLLGKALRSGTQVSGFDLSGRRLAGAAASEVSLSPLDPAVQEPDWVRLRWTDRSKADVRGSLSISPGASAPGDLTVAGRLHVAGSAQINNAFVGGMFDPNWAAFAHKDAGDRQYALLARKDGKQTLINTGENGSIEFRFDNATYLLVDGSRLLKIDGPLQVNSQIDIRDAKGGTDSDVMQIQRVSRGSDQTDLRIVIGDNFNTDQDRFVIGALEGNTFQERFLVGGAGGVTVNGSLQLNNGEKISEFSTNLNLADGNTVVPTAGAVRSYVDRHLKVIGGDIPGVELVVEENDATEADVEVKFPNDSFGAAPTVIAMVSKLNGTTLIGFAGFGIDSHSVDKTGFKARYYAQSTDRSVTTLWGRFIAIGVGP
jgi:hypothetical protein